MPVCLQNREASMLTRLGDEQALASAALRDCADVMAEELRGPSGHGWTQTAERPLTRVSGFAVRQLRKLANGSSASSTDASRPAPSTTRQPPGRTGKRLNLTSPLDT